jgi:hypothetical protein
MAWRSASFSSNADDRSCNGVWIVKWNQHASFVRQQFLGVPVRCGDNGLAGSQRDGQRAGDNLRLLPVGRDVNVGRAYMLHKFFRTHKAVVQNQLRRNTKLLGQRLQLFAIALAFAPPDMGMRYAGNDIRPRSDAAPELQAALESHFQCPCLERAAEGQQNGLAFGAELVLEVVGVHEGMSGTPCGITSIFPPGTAYTSRSSSRPVRSSQPCDRKAARSLRARCADLRPARAELCAA